MNRKLMMACRFLTTGVVSAFMLAGVAGLYAQELSLTDEDMQYNAGMKEISVDGDMSDWSGLPVKKSIPFEQGGELVLFEEYGGGTWSGPSDHTSSVAFAWDVENLYIGVVVTDDTHQNGNNGWNGDSIQAVFANAAQDTVTHLYNYALGDSGDLVIHNERGEGGTELAVVRDDDSATTTYEIALPAASLGLDSYELDMQIGIGLCVNDGDTDAGQAGQMGWSGWGPYAAVYGKTASATGLVSLTAKHDAVPNKPLVTKLLDFGGDEEEIGGVTGQASPAPWISITKLVMDEAYDLGDGVSITARDDGFNPNNTAPPNEDAEHDGIVVPQEARNDYLFKITDTAGTEARMQIDGLPAGKYNVTLFEGRTSDAAQYAKVWVGDAEPEVENTGDFAKGSATVEVTVAAGQTLWYKHLEDNSGGISGMIIRQTSAPGAGSPLLVDLVSHWPLDEISGETTPDVIGGRDMSLTNLDDSSVVEGKVGNAFSFSNAEQTLLSYVSEGEGDDLPINKHDSFTVSFWSKVNGTGQNDLRLFSESNTQGDGTPLFNIGTRNNGSDGTIDIFIRGAGPTVGHIFSTAEPFDGEWHHVVFVQNDLERSIYVDGELDDLEIAAKQESGWDNIDATTIGGILRSDPSHWVTGDLDEVALWKRALSAEEVASVFTDGVPQAPMPEISFTWDFDAGLPEGSDVAGSAEHSSDEGVDGSGALVLTRNVASQSGGWLSPDIGTVDKFKITFDIYIADGTDTQADGLSMAISDDLDEVAHFGEEGPAVGGSKLIVCFDNWDNGGGEGPAIDIKWGKEVVATVAMGSQGSSTLDTEGWWPVSMELTKSGDLTILYNDEVIHDAVNIPGFEPISNARIAFGGRTGGANANQFIDNFKIIIQEATGAIALPYISKITKGAGGIGIMVTDEATVGVDPDSVVVSLNGTEVAVTKSKADGVTSVTYTAADLLASESEHVVNLTYVGTDGESRSFERTVKIKAYSLLDPTHRVPDSMKGESGFLVYATQISSEQAPVEHLHGNRWQNAEKQIRGEYINGEGERYLNEADPEAWEGWTYTPEIVEWVNQNQDAPDEIGNFKASNGYEDEPLTGIPGWSAAESTDGIASEYLTMLELPVGSHTFGVNSDDGFSATFAGNYLDIQQQQVGLFDGGRGSADSTFTFYVKEAGLYPFRVSWWEGGGGANIEIFSKIGKEKVLINDRDVEGAIKAWAPKDAVVDVSTTERASTGRAYISGLSPADGTFAGTKSIELTVVNGSLSTLDEGSVKFNYDGELVNHSVVSDGDARVITYDATSGGNGKHTALVEFADSAGNARSVEWSFTLADALVPGAPNPIAFWDFNFTGSPSRAVDHVSGRTGNVVGGTYIEDSPTGEEGDYAMDLKSAGAHVNVADGEFLNITATVDAISVSFWQKNYSTPNTASFIGVSPSSSHNRGFFAHVPWSNGQIYWDTVGCCDANTQRINADANDIGGWPGEALNQWHHYVFVKDRSNKSIWVDGDLLHEGVNTSPLPMDLTSLVIGADLNGGISVNGAIDDFAIFASALSEDQIMALAEGDREILPEEPGYPLLANNTPIGLASSADVIEVSIVKRVDAIVDASLAINGEAVDVDAATEGNTMTLTAKSNPSKTGMNSATVSYNGREHSWTYFYYGEPLKDDAENLIGHWDFESGTKDSVYGLEGELLNGAALAEMDERNVLDLSAGGTSTMKVAPGDLLNLTAMRDQVTVTFWQKYKSIGNTSSFNGQSTSASHTRGFHGHAPWGSGAIYWDTVGCCDANTQRIDKANPGFDYKQWHHYAFVKDKGKKSIWVDGELFHQGNNSAALPMDMTALWVGSTTDGGGSVNGAIDDFKVFAQALTGGQIAGQFFQGQDIVISIAEQPASATGTLGWDHVFTVKASATADGVALTDSQLNYQWYRNGSAIDGANGSTLNTGILGVADDGSKYSVKIDQGGVAVDSAEAVLTVAEDSTPPGLASANATQPDLDSGGGAALRFNGSGNYVSVEADIPETEYTVEFWFRTEDPNAGLYCVVDQNLGAGGHDRHLHLVDGNIRIRTWSGDGIKQSSGLNLADGEWHHLAHVLGADAEGQKIYIDGEVVVEQAKDFSNFDWQKHLNFGFSNDAASQYLVGEMDELRVWEVVRTEEEIKANMNKPLTGDEDWLFAYYRFDEVGGTVLPDLLEGYDGVLMGMGDNNWVASSAPLGQAVLDGIPVPTTIQVSFDETIRNPGIGSGGSLIFDGKGAHVALPNEFPQTMTGLEAMTVEYWFNGTSFQSAVRWQDGQYIVAGWNGLHIISTEGGTAGIQVGPAADGKWHHVAMTWEMDGLWTSYLDGELVEERDAGAAPLPAIGSMAYLGCYGGSSEFTDGKLDEVRVWSVARTQEQLTQWKDKSLDDGVEGLVAYYKFDELGGNTLPDSSGNDYHGQLKNMTDANWSTGPNASFTKVGAKGQAAPGVFEIEGAQIDSVEYLADGRTVEIVAYGIGSTAKVTINGVRDTGDNEIDANTSFEINVNTGDISFGPTLVEWTGANGADIFDEANWDLSNSSVTVIDPNVSIDADVVISNATVDIPQLDAQQRFQVASDFTITVDNSTISLSGGSNDGIGGAPGATLPAGPAGPTLNVVNGSSLEAFFIVNGTTLSVDSTSTATLGGGGNPVNGSVIDLEPGATLTFTRETIEQFNAEHLSKLTIGGAAAEEGVNFSIESDGNSGSIIKTSGAGGDAPSLSVVNNGDGTVTITFEGKLQAAETVNGPWQDVDGASPMTISADQAQQYGRAVSE